MKYYDPLLISPNAGGHISKIPLRDLKEIISLPTRHSIVLLIIHGNFTISVVPSLSQGRVKIETISEN